jgi:hypothetical protein
MEMKNNEWNVPSDYFEKNKKALMPVRKFPTGKWLLALAAACVIGVGILILKGEDIGSKNLSTNRGSNHLSPEKENIGAKNLSLKQKNIGAKYLSPKEEIAEELKEIPKEELVAYLLDEDSDLIENID